jgi:putative heme degradation protein
MTGKMISNLVIVGYVLVVLAVLLFAGPAYAGDDMLPVDAKLGQYITPRADWVSAAENDKLAQYLDPLALVAADEEPAADDFDYEAAADNLAARWAAMGEFYASHGMLNGAAVAVEKFDYEAAVDNLAARWAAMGEFYASHGMLNEAAVARLQQQESTILQGAG